MNKAMKDLELSSGLGKFIHALTWPIRKFYIIIPILALIYATPIFFDVKPDKVHIWYKNKAIETWNNAPRYLNKAKAFLGMKVAEIKDMTTKQERGVDTLAEAPVRKNTASKRKTFGTGGSEIQRVEVQVESNDEAVLEQALETSAIVVALTPAEPKKEAVDESANFTIKPSAQKLQLVYLQTPKNITGKAVVKNSNEIEVGGVYIVLYGIYAEPNTLSGAQARAYLETKAKRGDIKCSIVAYTYQNVATAVCFYDKENINRSLIEKGYSKNIALE